MNSSEIFDEKLITMECKWGIPRGSHWPLCSRRALRSSSRHDGLQMHGRLWTFSSANSGSHGTAELSRVGFTFMFLLNKLSQVWEEHGENGLLLQVYFSRQGMLESWTSTPSWNELLLSWPFLISLNGCLNWGKEGNMWNYKWNKSPLLPNFQTEQFSKPFVW